MFKFRNHNTTDDSKTYLSLDIGTEYIKTVLFQIEDRTVKVLGYDRVPQKANAMRGALIINLQDVIELVDSSIGNALEQAEENLGEKIDIPKKAVLGIAGEIVKGVPIVVEVERENSESKITSKEINDIVSRIKKQTFADAKEDIAMDTGIKTSQITEIATVLDSVYIDNVKVDNPLGFRGENLVYRVFSTFAPKIHLNSIKDVAASLKMKDHQVIVEPYALATSMKNARQENFSAIIIDIGGGTTDIAVISNGAVVGTKMFAFGGRVFTKRIQKEFDLDYLAAEKMKIDYTDEKLTKAETKQIAGALKQDVKIWLDGVELSLQEFEDLEVFPSQIYICGGGALLPEIQSSLLAHPWLQVLPFNKFPQVNFLFPNQVRDVEDKTRKATNVQDVTPLALARTQLD